MTQVKEPGLTEEQFRKICNWLLMYAYVLLAIQIAGVGLYIISIAIGRSPEDILLLVLATLLYSLWRVNNRQRFFKKQLVNNGVNGSVGYELSYRHNVFWWAAWCFVEIMLSVAILSLSVKAIFGAG